MLLEGGQVGKRITNVQKNSMMWSQYFWRSSGENQRINMINMIIYYIYHWLLIKILQLVSMCMVEYSMMRSAGVTIALKIFIIFNPRKVLCQAGVVALTYMPFGGLRCTVWGDVWKIWLTRKDVFKLVHWYMCKGNSLSKSSLVLDEHYNGSIPKAESLHVDTFCYCHIGKSMELITLELNWFGFLSK